MNYFTLRVADIRRETKDSVTVLFKQPALKKVKYLPGQYLSVIFKINNRRYIRPYSFSSSPGIDPTLNITVKRVSEGVVSNHIIDKLKIDDIIEVIEPMGDFTLKDEMQKSQLYLWGAGSGITPLISIAKFALFNSKFQFVTLVYGNRDFENIILKNEIDALENQFKQTFSAKHFLTIASIETENPNIIQGRIAAGKIEPILKERESNLDDALHYICGPQGLKESLNAELIKLGVLSSNIFFEDFEIKRNHKDFENIITRDIIIKKNGEALKVEVAAGKSILEAALDSFIEISYSCQTGNCLLCRARVLNGEFKVIGIDTLPDELNADECLLCSSYPISNNLELEVE